MLLEASVAATVAAAAKTGRFNTEELRQFREQLLWFDVMHDKRVPRLPDVFSAEKALSKTRCVGSIRRWNRKYSYAARQWPARLDTSRVEFNLSTPHSHVQPGFTRVSPGWLYTVDDGDFDTVHGFYGVRTKKIVIDFCGPNHPHAR